MAACDRELTLAYPVETVAARPDPVPRLRELVALYEPVAVVVGLPRTLEGTEGPAAARARDWAAAVAAALAPVPVGLVDERLSTAAAAKQMAAAGRGSRARRGVVDQAAAVTILESVLDADRRGQSTWQRVNPPVSRPEETR